MLLYAGDIIIDTSMLRSIDIEPPQADKPYGYTALSDRPTKGKGKEAGLPPHTSFPSARNDLISNKRRRDDSEVDSEEKTAYEARLRSYDTASPAVSSFLSGPALSRDSDEPPREHPKTRSTSSESEDKSLSPSKDMATSSRSGSGSASGRGSGRESSQSTTATTPDSQSPLREDKDESKWEPPSSWRNDPFGYMNTTPPMSSSMAGGPAQAQSVSHPSYQPWSAALPSNSSMSASFSASTNMFQAFDVFNAVPQVNNLEPMHPHAYVTFGAGMKQKEIDIYTASNPLEAKSMTFSRFDGRQITATIPYHIPT